MIHIYKNSKGKYEVAVVSKNGNYVLGSKQGYERKRGAYTAIRSAMKAFDSAAALFQDDTLLKPEIFVIDSSSIHPPIFKIKPSKPYTPSTSKK